MNGTFVPGPRGVYEWTHRLYHRAVPYRYRLVFWAERRRWLRRAKKLAQAADRRLVALRRRELADIVAQHPDAPGTVVFLPSVDWHIHLFQRPHQMALAFASLGYLVFFLIDADSADGVQGFRAVADGLYLCDVPPAVLRDLADPITIAYTYNYQWVRRLGARRIVYELIDHLDIFTDYAQSLLRWRHGRLLKHAKVVVGTADDLVVELREARPDAILVPNGVDVDHFARAATGDIELPADMRSILDEGKPIVGYYGALAEWFDYDLVKYAARALPEYNFVLIGPDYDSSITRSGIVQVPNVHWLGPKAYTELPAYLHAFDVATIPFKTTKALQAVSPIKLFEYMAGQRPIVTTDLAECHKYPVVGIATSAQEWVTRLREAVMLHHDPRHIAALQATAEQNTWQQRASHILDAVAASEAHDLASGR